jgi:hypothetical protein
MSNDVNVAEMVGCMVLLHFLHLMDKCCDSLCLVR